MKPIIEIINQLNLLESKVNKTGETERSFNRMRQALSELGFSYSSPLNEEYKDTRTDVEATIVGLNSDKLVITNVIKPIIVQDSKIIQRAVVIVESK